ncbi:response regulator transcription factor [Pseudomonas aeruginosa]|uniref:response regulator transcription factor n=1 Tax=Pseudomonas aeruginosa TaxID=287 RepID=UPI000E677FDF|nr:helix-turn-helix transcriptional regulator [Pseudomonas aeruginosa]RIZ12813.1 helix-turn-helix transcriptional regulator [Pseudomonas aeruginosa]
MDSVIQIGAWKGSSGALLAERELACLLSLASGMTDKEIAKLMGIAPGTVSKRLDDARFKLGAKTIRGLVLEAYKRQIISPLCVGILAILAAAQPLLDEDPAMRARRGGERKIETRLTARRDGVAWVA